MIILFTAVAVATVERDAYISLHPQVGKQANKFPQPTVLQVSKFDWITRQ